MIFTKIFPWDEGDIEIVWLIHHAFDRRLGIEVVVFHVTFHISNFYVGGRALGGVSEYSRDLLERNFIMTRTRCEGTENMLSECDHSRPTNHDLRVYCRDNSDIAAVECYSK